MTPTATAPSTPAPNSPIRAAGPVQTGATAAPAGTRPSLIGSDFETFLRMLTTQLRNQDPLSPMESTDFAVQLATFAGVEQQTLTNQRLAGLAASLGSGDIGRLAGWIGMEARVAGPVRHEGGPRTLELAPDPAADQVLVRISDTAGRAVGFIPAPTAAGSFEWDGVTGAGTPLEAGSYIFTLENYAGSELISTAAVETFAPVTETRLDADGNGRIVLAGGHSVAAQEVRALRLPRG